MSLQFTQYEISKKINDEKRTFSILTNKEKSTQKCLRSRQRRLDYFTTRLQKLPENSPKRNDYSHIIRFLNHKIEVENDRHQQLIRNLEETKQKMEEYESMRGMYLSPISSQPSEVVTLLVRLLSGDVLEVIVDRSHPMSGFADQFANQNHYEECVTTRMVFLIMSEKEEKEQTFWSHEERHIGKSIGDVLGSELPILNLFIRPVEDPDYLKTVTIMRKILYSLKRDDSSFSNEELFDLYNNWRMTHNVSSMNRYQKLKACIDEHLEMFNLLSEDEMGMKNRHWDMVAFCQFRRNYHPRPHHLPTGQNMIRHILRENGNDAVLPVYQIVWILRLMTVGEMLENGIRIQNIPPTWKYYRFVADWHNYVREADNM
jgi:hypothetical protein